MYNVYVFIDNRNIPYYVGKTNNMIRRENEHRKAILSGDTLPKYNAARKFIRNGTPFKMRSIRTTVTEIEAYRLERLFIAKFRKSGYKLYNCTSGGPYEFPIKINKPIKPNRCGIVFKKLSRRKRR